MALRMIEVVASNTSADDFSDLPKDCAVMGLWRESLDEKTVWLRALVESERAEPVINAFEKAFNKDEIFRILIFEVAATVPQPEKEDKKDEDSESDQDRIACAELVEKLSNSSVVRRPFLLLTVLSAIVASIGLVQDSVAVIIGAMVIAPLLEPNMSLALATTLGDIRLARRAMITNIIGFTLAFVLAVAIGMILPFDPENEQIALRTQISLFDVAVGLASGVAGALAFTTGVSGALVGVMVAVALLPPLVTAGLLVGTAAWAPAYGAALLLATNVISINLAGVATFLFQKVRPSYWWEAKRARRMATIALSVWIGLLVILVALILLSGSDLSLLPVTPKAPSEQ